jgi:inosose dehydratase
MVTRRELLRLVVPGVALPGLASALGSNVASALERAADAPSIRFGYAAITWGNAIEQAMDDISAVGFRGIQLRLEAFDQFGDRPAALRDLLQRKGLTFAALSSGNLSIDPAREAAEIDRHLQHARFLRAAGGLYLQVIDERPKGRPIVADDYRRLGRLLTTLGRRVADAGVTLVYHHHMNSLGERPNEVAAVLDAADRRHVRLLFDVAHYQQGGGDPVAALRQYREWIQVLHLKDVRSGGAGAAGAAGGTGNEYQFVELGRGRVDLPGVFKALSEIKFRDWAIVELDRVPDPGRTPKESADMNRRYLVETMHATL